jgi:hypothetical protein
MNPATSDRATRQPHYIAVPVVCTAVTVLTHCAAKLGHHYDHGASSSGPRPFANAVSPWQGGLSRLVSWSLLAHWLAWANVLCAVVAITVVWRGATPAYPQEPWPCLCYPKATIFEPH